MNELESAECQKFADDVICYAWGQVPEERRSVVEEHLKECPSCSKLVSFVKRFVRATREGQADRNPPPTPHPDPSLIVDLEADELDEATARQVSLHLLDCKSCREAYLRLRRLSNEQFEKRVLEGDYTSPEVLARLRELADEGLRLAEKLKRDQINQQWQKLLDGEIGIAIHLGRIYGPGTVLGPIRVLTESPGVTAVGWESTLLELLDSRQSDLEASQKEPRLSKVLEIRVAENLYRVEISVTSKMAVSCDIAGLHTPLRMRLLVLLWLRSCGDNRAVETTTDEFGNVHLEEASAPGAFFALRLTLKGEEQWLVCRVPGEGSFLPPSEERSRAIEEGLLTRMVLCLSPEEAEGRLKRIRKLVEFLERLAQKLSHTGVEPTLGSIKKNK